MKRQLVTTVVMLSVSGSLFAAEQFMVRAKRKGSGAFSMLQSRAPIQVLELSSADAENLRVQGYMVEKNGRMYMADTTISGPMPGNGSDSQEAIYPGQIMNLANAHALTSSRGENQTVCVVDTGIDAEHEMFAGQHIETYNAIDQNLPAADGQGHGTFVASLVLGAKHPSAPAPAANLLAVKALDDNGSGTYADVARGIEHCASRASVINLSLGGSEDSQIIRELIQETTAQGVSVVAAVSNNGNNIVGYPAAYPEVIAVGSVDKDLQAGRFSSSGPELGIVAPGVNVWGALPGNSYAVHSGNSMATGFVSGVVALQRSRGAKGLIGRDLGLPRDVQGIGLVDAYATAMNISY